MALLPIFAELSCDVITYSGTNYENWLGLVNIYVYSARQTRAIYQLLSYSVDFNTPGCSLIWNKGHVKNWNNRKAQR